MRQSPEEEQQVERLNCVLLQEVVSRLTSTNKHLDTSRQHFRCRLHRSNQSDYWA